MDEQNKTNLAELTSEIVAAYVAKNSIRVADLPELISSIHSTLGSLGKAAPSPAEAEQPKPAVPIKKSVTDNYLVSLFDGRKLKSLKRHLSAEHGMTPAEYRTMFGLPRDYPMVAPAYAKQRSSLAKSLGLGRRPPRNRLCPARQPEKGRSRADGGQGHAGWRLASRAAPRTVAAGSCRPATRAGRSIERRRMPYAAGAIPRRVFSVWRQDRAPLARRAERPAPPIPARRVRPVSSLQTPGYAEKVVPMPCPAPTDRPPRGFAPRRPSDGVRIPKTLRRVFDAAERHYGTVQATAR